MTIVIQASHDLITDNNQVHIPVNIAVMLFITYIYISDWQTIQNH